MFAVAPSISTGASVASVLLIYTARILELRTKRDTVAGPVREQTTLRLFILAGTAMVIGSITEQFVVARPFHLAFFVAGWLFALASFAIRRSAIRALGRFWSLHVEIRASHELVREGPFQWVRHPVYTSMIFELLSFALLLESAFTAAAVQACAGPDGVISSPSGCHWNPDELIGQVTPCGVITRQDATVMEKIWQGPETTSGRKLWSGIDRGADLSGVAATTTSSTGATTGNPYPGAVTWLGTWLQQNPSWNWQTLTYTQFDTLFRQSVREFSKVLATNDPNLKTFRKDGGKLLLWHGLADQYIPVQGTIDYYHRVQHAVGGPEATASFARLFLAPGAQHCESAAGPAPSDPLAAVVAWVEHGQAPTEIPATVVDSATGIATASRPLCAYPLTSVHNGTGTLGVPAAYHCTAKSTIRPN